MSPAALRKWFEVAENSLATLQTRTEPGNTMASHLATRGFPETEMNALRAALRAVEEELQNLQQAVYTDMQM